MDQHEVVVSLIPIFYDKNVNQASPEHVKILLDNNKIITKKVTFLHKDIKNCLEELFSEYIKVHYEWPSKELLGCRKKDNIIEILYTTNMPFINGSHKNGMLINISEFANTIEDKYYVESISGNTRRF